MPEASQGRRVWDLSDEMIKERRWSFELALRRELDETERMILLLVTKVRDRPRHYVDYSPDSTNLDY